MLPMKKPNIYFNTNFYFKAYPQLKYFTIQTHCTTWALRKAYIKT